MIGFLAFSPYAILDMKYYSSKLGNTNGSDGEGGFILLLTVLITSVILAISFSIYSISLKEMVLASFLDNAARAFVAADRGIECALYWDRATPQNGMQYTIFATSSDWTSGSLAMGNAICDGNVLTASGWSSPVGVRTLTHGISSFSITFGDSTCVDMVVSKDDDSTTVTANGYNSCLASNVRKTQRTIEVRYNL